MMTATAVWVLILWIDYYGPAVTTAEFSNQAQCHAAGKAAAAAYIYYGDGRHAGYTCTQK